LSSYDSYDISHIKKDLLTSEQAFSGERFNFKRILSPEVKFFSGGIRSDVFGLKNVWLTKIPLLFYSDSLEPLRHQHFSNNATIADVSTVLFHYKFTHHFPEQIKDAVEHEQYLDNSKEYKKYDKVSENLNFKQVADKKLGSTDQLIESQFLVVSEAYKKLV